MDRAALMPVSRLGTFLFGHGLSARDLIILVREHAGFAAEMFNACLCDSNSDTSRIDSQMLPPHTILHRRWMLQKQVNLAANPTLLFQITVWRPIRTSTFPYR
jgi:hypothetical protein